MIGYASILGLNLFFGVIFSIILLIDARRIKGIAGRELKKLDILNDLVALDLKIQSRNVPKNAYLSQIDNFLGEDPFDIDKRKIVVCKARRGNEIDQKIYRLYKNAPSSVKEDMETLSKILGRIYALNHPIKFKMLELKKNIRLHFLLFFLRLCCFLIKWLDKCDESKNKKSVKMLKSQQKKFSKYPKSVLMSETPLGVAA